MTTEARQPHVREALEPVLLNIDEIEQRLAAATPGPWIECKNGGCTCGRVFASRGGSGEVVAATKDLGHHLRQPANAQTNAALIAHAPQDLADLIAEVKRLRAGVPFSTQLRSRHDPAGGMTMSMSVTVGRRRPMIPLCIPEIDVALGGGLAAGCVTLLTGYRGAMGSFVVSRVVEWARLGLRPNLLQPTDATRAALDADLRAEVLRRQLDPAILGRILCDATERLSSLVEPECLPDADLLVFDLDEIAALPPSPARRVLEMRLPSTLARVCARESGVPALVLCSAPTEDTEYGVAAILRVDTSPGGGSGMGVRVRVLSSRFGEPAAESVEV